MFSRRNLDRADRDEMIRRLAARGVKQKDIADTVRLKRQTITHIIGNSDDGFLSRSQFEPESPGQTSTSWCMRRVKSRSRFYVFCGNESRTLKQYPSDDASKA